VQHQQVRALAWRDGISAPLIVAELHQQCPAIEPFDDRANLPARETLSRRSASNATTSSRDGASFRM